MSLHVGTSVVVSIPPKISRAWSDHDVMGRWRGVRGVTGVVSKAPYRESVNYPLYGSVDCVYVLCSGGQGAHSGCIYRFPADWCVPQ